MHKTVATGAAAFCAFLTVILFAQPAAATTISFTPAPANIGVLFSNTDVDVFSTGLNGMTLSGQSLSLDLVLTNDLLARIQLLEPEALGVGLTVFTNAASFPGFAGTTTGFLLNPSGLQAGPAQEAGRTQGSDGSFSTGLVSFTGADFGGAGIIDISGVHFDTSFPNTGFVVTNARLRFSLDDNRLMFGTAQQL
ncbi:MAG TPA: hypothetical protein VFE29_00090, partial [Terriglobia bacterium]|nr:hypothetical protein [Terriglobia bacterium]